MKRVLDFSRWTVALGLRVTQAILLAVHAVVALLCRLIGVRPPAVPQLPLPQVTPTAVMDRYESALDRATEKEHEPVCDVGAAVHQYASATDPSVRSAVDLTGLRADQFGWLMGLADDDLRRLAAAGPVACQRAITAKRSGIVGLPEMKQAALEPVVGDPEERMREALRERISAARVRKLAAVA